ncbi:MAG: hypothetical protein ALECFALPRED_008712 [Alectoria fallacina]|uniref:ER-bound oxygenase mpaB/mpaB'/Rubber oxygenase catalytic domain-containing protein n=1 Tax=Alectoria fallacina TaxID=1903189 RepID=A0A8H3J4V8_9LECA|nr:MAG: hypothetical protein ALECFALPRED_008712 [Alectoria fallacina]
MTDDDSLAFQLPLAFSPYSYPLFCLFYLTLVAFFRGRRLRSTLVKHPYSTRASFASMTNEDAYLIQKGIGELEFPFTFEKSLQFALFRTYGIPTISKLLVQTNQLSEGSTATKRYTDTTVLIAEFLGYHPTSARSIEAIGRMNYIHSQYQESGKILDDDLLYTLSLFAGEPARWIDEYEWRKLEDFERCAIGAFWKAIGDAMGIGYEKLRGGEEGGQGWIDGLQWLDELKEWSAEYEKRFMLPDKNNQKTAEQTVAILLYSMPRFVKPYGIRIVSALMDDRLRTAMMYVHFFPRGIQPLHILSDGHSPRYEKPSQEYLILVSTLFTVRKFVLRYLMFPRPHFLRVHNTTDEPSQAGTYHMTVYETHPWYVKPTVLKRFEPRAWKNWIMGLPVPGDEGDKYRPNGYKIPEIGPDFMRGKGADFMRASKERLVGERMKGCPFGRLKE